MQARWAEVGDAIVLSAVMGVLFVAAENRRIEPLLPVLGSFVVALLAFVVLDAADAPGGPVAVVIPALFVLIPGDYLSAAVGELAIGQVTAGAVRLIGALFVIVGLAVGVVIAAIVSGTGTQALVELDVPVALPGWALLLSWIPFSVGLTLAFDAWWHDLPWIMGLVNLAYGALQAGSALFGPTTGTFLAAAVLGACAEWLSRRPTTPPRLVLVLGGFFVLTVGALGLRGLTSLIGGDTDGLVDLLDMATIATALSLGLLTGILAARRPWERVDTDAAATFRG